MGVLPYGQGATIVAGRYEKLPRAPGRPQRKHPVARAVRRMGPRRKRDVNHVQEMVQASRECSTRAAADDMKFAPFCVFVTTLKKKVPPPPVVCQPERPLRAVRPCKSAPPTCGKYEVFLGGSCNPTTWRHDEAIPRLKQLGITYYNPQVASWHPGLIALEEEAKQSATVLFFVIDNQTRAVSSMLEASYLAASGRKLVLVVSRLSGPWQQVCGETITNTEYCDLNRTQNYLQDLVERQGLPVFENIAAALDCTNKVLSKNIRVQDLQLSDHAVPVRNSHITLADKLHRLREVFANQDSEGRGSLSVDEVCPALRVACGRSICPNDVRQLMAQIREATDDSAAPAADPATATVAAPAEARLTFDQFCLLASELQAGGRRVTRSRSGGSMLSRTAEMMHHLLSPLTRVAEWVLPQRLARQLSGGAGTAAHPDVKDVYLGGTRTETSWREHVAIPVLKKQGLSFEHPASLLCSDRITPTEAARLERCRYLLFVIGDSSRGPAHMTMAAHYIGLGARVVLCVQMLPDNCTIQGEKLTPTAIKDYNRGRTYLSDLATRKGVPVFDTVAEAVQCVVQRCKQSR